jgi:hypothetical protein
VDLGVGSMVGEVKQAPEWWMDTLLTNGHLPYDGGDAKELVATAPLGPRPYGFDEVGAQIWVTLDGGWTAAGRFLALAEDPPWTLSRIGPERRPNAPRPTVPDPLTSHLSISGVRRVWLRENPRELWFAGRHGWGRHLHSVAVEETFEAVYLTCLIGWTGNYESKVDAAGGSESAVAIPMVLSGWTMRTALDSPLGRRKVLVRMPDR